MERETKTLTTPLGKELVVKSYVTARERNTFLTSAEKNGLVGDNPSSLATIKSAGDLVAAAIVSYDGSGEKILERLEDARVDEYDFVLTEAAGVIKGNFQEAK